jgi:hypothetical protein
MKLNYSLSDSPERGQRASGRIMPTTFRYGAVDICGALDAIPKERRLAAAM